MSSAGGDISRVLQGGWEESRTRVPAAADGFVDQGGGHVPIPDLWGGGEGAGAEGAGEAGEGAEGGHGGEVGGVGV